MSNAERLVSDTRMSIATKVMLGTISHLMRGSSMKTPGKVGLSREVQVALGEQLRAAYSKFLHHMPWKLVSLSQRIAHPTHGSSWRLDPEFQPAPFAEDAAFDPETLAILDEALEKAWDDLQSIKSPVTRETLALQLAALAKEERDPSRLAIKAVIASIVPSTRSKTE
jgi:hypothetical protein